MLVNIITFLDKKVHLFLCIYFRNIFIYIEFSYKNCYNLPINFGCETILHKLLLQEDGLCLNFTENASFLQNTIVSISDGHIITRWKTLHPKEEFSYGISYYVVKHGWKISKFYKENGTLAYIYCDIIDTSYDKNTDTYIFTDLLADVIIENDGFVRVVDLDELADACRMSIISNDMLVTSLHRLNALLSIIYNGDFKDYLDELERYEVLNPALNHLSKLQ